MKSSLLMRRFAVRVIFIVGLLQGRFTCKERLFTGLIICALGCSKIWIRIRVRKRMRSTVRKRRSQSVVRLTGR